MWKILHPEEDKTREPSWELRSRGQTAQKTARKAVDGRRRVGAVPRGSSAKTEVSCRDLGEGQ